MALVLELRPEVEERIRREAEQRGLDAADYAGRLLEFRLASAEPGGKTLWETLTPDEWIREFEAYCASHDPTKPPLSDYAVSREGIYEGRY